MTVYLDMVILLNFLVDYLLLLGTNRLCGHPPGWGRCAIAAGVGGIYGGLCLLPGFRFLGNTLWRMVSLGGMSFIAFGFCLGALRRGIVFVILCMALGGAATGMNAGGFWSILASAAIIGGMCIVGFRQMPGSVSYVPVVITYNGKKLHLTALCDTGNTLRDPITGRSVLVIGGDAAQKLTGLTRQQLESPVSTMEQQLLSGLRLVPYCGIGNSGSFLLALRIPDVRIGNWNGNSLVAFAPNQLCAEGDYQALTGGAA